MLMGVGGLWGHMGGRLRVGWEAGFGVNLVIDVQKEEEKKIRLTLVQHDTPPSVPTRFLLPVPDCHPRHDHKDSQK